MTRSIANHAPRRMTRVMPLRLFPRLSLNGIAPALRGGAMSIGAALFVASACSNGAGPDAGDAAVSGRSAAAGSSTSIAIGGTTSVPGTSGTGALGASGSSTLGAGGARAGNLAVSGKSGGSGNGGGSGASGTGGSPSMAGSGTAGSPSAGQGGESGASGSAGESATCALPMTFKWTSGAALAQPKNGWVSLKDFTHVLYNGKHVVYMTTHDQSNWGAAMFTFADWPEAATATQTPLAFGVAPTLFYFTPKKLWVLAYQWGRTKFSYRTSSDPTDPNGWSAEQSLYNTALPTGGTGPIDQTVICNSTKCYLYYAGDDGHIYKSSMPIGNFPSEFPAGQDSGIQGTTQNLFEAVQVYSIKGSNKYLMIVEAQGSARYFRSWTATDLDGLWTLYADPFAAKDNVTFSTAWTNDISHGDLIRENPDETFTVDPCNLQMLFQGRDPSVNVDYGLLPYRPGLLTLARQ